jgi:hypothetical protein
MSILIDTTTRVIGQGCGWGLIVQAVRGGK